MSDYLSNLLERSLKTDKVLRPRPAGVFEPPLLMDPWDSKGSLQYMEPVRLEEEETPAGELTEERRSVRSGSQPVYGGEFLSGEPGGETVDSPPHALPVKDLRGESAVEAIGRIFRDVHGQERGPSVDSGLGAGEAAGRRPQPEGKRVFVSHDVSWHYLQTQSAPGLTRSVPPLRRLESTLFPSPEIPLTSSPPRVSQEVPRPTSSQPSFQEADQGHVPHKTPTQRRREGQPHRPAITEKIERTQRLPAPPTRLLEPRVVHPGLSYVPADPPPGSKRLESPAPVAERPMASPGPAATIKVTIGRIEVRAVMPAAPSVPPLKAVRTTPSLSLEDYLKQRSGERS